MSTTPAGPEEYQVGDLVFIRMANFLYRRVAQASNSWTAHVGMLSHQDGKEWIVAESAVPLSRYCSLTRFIRRSERGQFAIMRLKTPMDSAAQERLQKEARSRLGKWYHFGFDFDSRHQFCSKFVYEVYQSALGVNIGSVESFRELLARNPTAPQTFWKMWFFGRIPWDRRTITPGSQFESALLRRVGGTVTVPPTETQERKDEVRVAR